MIPDGGPSYDAEELLGVQQQKCLDHLQENIHEVLDCKAGRSRSFGLKLKSILRKPANPGATNGLARPTGSRARWNGWRENSPGTCARAG
jgi:hypothetical protein